MATLRLQDAEKARKKRWIVPDDEVITKFVAKCSENNESFDACCFVTSSGIRSPWFEAQKEETIPWNAAGKRPGSSAGSRPGSRAGRLPDDVAGMMRPDSRASSKSGTVVTRPASRQEHKTPSIRPRNAGQERQGSHSIPSVPSLPLLNCAASPQGGQGVISLQKPSPYSSPKGGGTGSLQMSTAADHEGEVQGHREAQDEAGSIEITNKDRLWVADEGRQIVGLRFARCTTRDSAVPSGIETEPWLAGSMDTALRVFQAWDADGSGAIDEHELTSSLVASGIAPKEARRLFQAADKDKDGVIDFNDFVVFLFEEVPAAVRDRTLFGLAVTVLNSEFSPLASIFSVLGDTVQFIGDEVRMLLQMGREQSFRLFSDEGELLWADQSLEECAITDGSQVFASFRAGIQKIYANSEAVAAVLKDGTVETWGAASAGGNSSTAYQALQFARCPICYTTGLAELYTNSPCGWRCHARNCKYKTQSCKLNMSGYWEVVEERCGKFTYLLSEDGEGHLTGFGKPTGHAEWTNIVKGVVHQRRNPLCLSPGARCDLCAATLHTARCKDNTMKEMPLVSDRDTSIASWGDIRERLEKMDGFDLNQFLASKNLGEEPNPEKEYENVPEKVELAMSFLEGVVRMHHVRQVRTWIYDPANNAAITIRAQPAMNGKRSGHSMHPGEIFTVSETRLGSDGLLYLRLDDDRGWLFDRKPGVGIMCRPKLWMESESASMEWTEFSAAEGFKLDGMHSLSPDFRKAWKHGDLLEAGAFHCTLARDTFSFVGSGTAAGDVALKFTGRRVGRALENVQSITASATAFAALREDGSVSTWGDPHMGGNSLNVQDELHSVKAIFATAGAFAALRKDGTVVTWGAQEYGANSSAVQDQLKDVVCIYSNPYAFAARTGNGGIITWGVKSAGGCSKIRGRMLAAAIKDVQATNHAFAAVRKDGRVVVWGLPSFGGDPGSAQEELVRVVSVAATSGAFAAVKQDGSVVAWGSAFLGGDCKVTQESLTGVKQCFATASAFAALRHDGTVVTWGKFDGGGQSNFHNSIELTNVKHIYATRTTHAYHYASEDAAPDGLRPEELPAAFAALTWDGSVISWGHPKVGGDSAAVQDQLVNVKEIYTTVDSFAAWKDDGSVVVWGAIDCSSVSSQLVDIEDIIPTLHGFTALKRNGSVVSWGLFGDCKKRGTVLF